MYSAKGVLDKTKFLNLVRRLNEKAIHASKWNDSRKLKEEIMSDRRLTGMFAELYFVDYKIFGIALPQFIIDFRLYDNS